MQREILRMIEGTIDEQKGYLEFSCQKIEFDALPDEIYDGYFTVSVSDGEPFEGKVYSTNSRLQIEQSKIQGTEAQVPYFFDAHGLEKGQTILGNIAIITDRGEYRLPYQIQIVSGTILSSMGEIRNVFHFANLAKENWEEAVELFYTEDFMTIFEETEKQYKVLYHGFSKNLGNEENVDQFLKEVNKKDIVQYKLDCQEVFLEESLENQVYTVNIEKNGWGYTELFVEATEEFIRLQKMQLTKADFEGNIAQFSFMITRDKLHNGLNQGKIVFYNHMTRLELQITVEKAQNTSQLEKEKEEKIFFLSLATLYENYRLHKMNEAGWLKQTRKILDQMLMRKKDDLFLQLLNCDMLLKEGRKSEAEWMFGQLILHNDFSMEREIIYAYYLYLAAIMQKEDNSVENSIEIISRIQQKYPEKWEYISYLLYLDQSVKSNPEMKLQILEEQFKKGCHSPMLYIEAYNLYQEDLGLLSKADTFEENVLWYAVKRQALQVSCLDKIYRLAEEKKVFSKRMLDILIAIYQKWEENEFLFAICSYLIKGNKIGTEYFKWYQLAVDKNLRVTRLYDYYMMSMDLNYQGKIPKMVLMFFAYQADLDYEHAAFLYAYIEKHKEEIPEIERSYRKQIETFAIEQIKAGHVNQDLAYIYQNVITSEILTQEIAYIFVPLVFMNIVRIEDEHITNVILKQKKVIGESSYPVTDKKAFIPIYSKEYQIFLQDKDGNRFSSTMNYEVETLMQAEQMIPVLRMFISNRLGIDLFLCEEAKENIAIDSENEERLRFLADSEQIEPDYKKEIRIKLLYYYYDNDRINELDSYLEEAEAEMMDQEERAEFLKFLISRGLFDKALEWSRMYGTEKVKVKSVARLISKGINNAEFSYENFLLIKSYEIFQSNKYDENILAYIVKYFQGTIQELRDIWKAAAAIELDTHEILERMLKQMLFAKSFVGEKTDILMEYISFPEHDEELAYAFMTYSAYEYFLYDSMISSDMMQMLLDQFFEKGDINLPCKLAMLKYFADNPEEFVRVAGHVIPNLMETLIQNEMYFPFFQKLTDYVPELEKIMDDQFVEYRTKPNSRVLLRYVFEKRTGEREYITEEMKEMYCGIYLKTFKLFDDECVQYYIIETDENNEEKILASATLQNDETKEYQKMSRYHMLNDLIISMKHADYSSVNRVIEEYEEKDYLTQDIFHIMI